MNNTANTREERMDKTWRRLKRIAIVWNLYQLKEPFTKFIKIQTTGTATKLSEI